MAAWPSTLPLPLFGSYSETRAPNVIRSDMDLGPDKLRRRSTADVIRLDFSLLLTDAQLAALDAFHATTLLSGVLSFDYTHPRTGAAVTARFVIPHQPTHASRGYWRVSISLEILP